MLKTVLAGVLLAAISTPALASGGCADCAMPSGSMDPMMKMGRKAPARPAYGLIDGRRMLAELERVRDRDVRRHMEAMQAHIGGDDADHADCGMPGHDCCADGDCCSEGHDCCADGSQDCCADGQCHDAVPAADLH